MEAHSISGPRGRGLAILETEVTIMTTALKRSNVWSRSDAVSAHPTLLKPFVTLRSELAGLGHLDDLDPSTFLAPFLDVIRSDVVTGHVTALALDAIHKFLSYELLHVDMREIANAIENIADAVTHARFVGVDPRSDEVVLMKILAVLRTLMLTPVGLLLTNEGVCEILQSTFRICFETRLSDLLRKTAELALNDMIQLLFTRLPSFSEESLPLLKKLKMRNSGQSNDAKSKRKKAKEKPSADKKKILSKKDLSPAPSAKPSSSDTPSPASAPSELASPTQAFNVDSDVLARSPTGSIADLTQIQSDTESEKPSDEADGKAAVMLTVTSPKGTETVVVAESLKPEPSENCVGLADEAVSEPNTIKEEFVNAQGVTFTPTAEMVDESGSLIPYGLPCVRELFRFLISLINPHDGSVSHSSSATGSSTTVGGLTFQNDSMIQVALSLLATALETGAEHLDKYESLLDLVKDDLARNLVALVASERVATFSAALWISYLVFATQRRHLKYQLEIFLTRLMDVVNNESNVKITYEHKELVLDMVVRLYKIPDFVTQLYVNYDCDLYTHNIFEDLTKMLSKNAFPVTGLYSTQFLSLDALLTVVEAIEKQCQSRITISSAAGRTDEPEIGHVEHHEVASSPSLNVRGSGHIVGKHRSPCRSTTPAKNEEPEDDGVSTHEELMALKYKKKLISSATELFNNKPSKGVAYMQEMGLLKTPLDPEELANFMRTNPHLDKKQLGEYISKRDHLTILKAFVESFDFAGLRVDESLRIFLETFRLPGEAPLISIIVEHFAEHWQKSNGDQFVNADAAFTLAYAVIMLNVDQHNKNHTKTNDPMTAEQFKRNLRGTNGGIDHDQDMLDEIYHAIRNEEIVMPAEQTGLVKENYVWKCALKRSAEGKQGQLASPKVMFDHDLFSIVWGPAVAALSYVFDKSRMNEAGAEELIERALNGFQRCSAIAAHYRMSDVVDNIVISLCKFSTLTKATETPYVYVPQFGANQKALLSTKTVFALAHKHGDILHDGWKNLLDCLLWLFKCQLLPNSLMESEDFVDSTGRVKLLPEEASPIAKVESGFLNSFVSFISMSTGETVGVQRPRTLEEEEAVKEASSCVKGCQIEGLINESKFLQVESLQQLVKHIIQGSNLDLLKEPQVVDLQSQPLSEKNSRATSPSSLAHEADSNVDEDQQNRDEIQAIFFLEFLVRITIQNKDRVTEIWPSVIGHVNHLILVASEVAVKRPFLLERSVNGLLRLAVRLARKEDLASLVVQSLTIMEGLGGQAMQIVARPIAFGLFELLRNNAANIHETEDWAVIFRLIEVVGAGASLTEKDLEDNGKVVFDEDSGHGASSESESATASSRTASPGHSGKNEIRERSGSIGSSSGGWIVLEKNESGAEVGEKTASSAVAPNSQLIHFDVNSLMQTKTICLHDSLAFLKCCESLAFLIRDVAHITPHNFNQCVHALRIFVEASFSARQHQAGVERVQKPPKQKRENPFLQEASKSTAKNSFRTPFNKNTNSHMRKVRSAPHNVRQAAGSSPNSNAGSDYDADESDGEDFSSEFHHVALQLLDLLHTLHTRAAQIHFSWAEEAETEDATWGSNPSYNLANTSRLWSSAWCPLLQGMARLCCDRRSHIRTSGLTSLQRALLFHDLQTLSSIEWEAAFVQVLFPMLNQLLIPSQPGERTAMEETRTRAATLLGKVFLQHLTPLTTLPSFTSLWLTILDFMEKFIKAASSDLLADAVPESLKNMLLVMDTAGIFFENGGSSATTPIWDLTLEKLESFLPNLMLDLFGDRLRGIRETETDPSAQAPPSSDSCAELPPTTEELREPLHCQEGTQEKMTTDVSRVGESEAGDHPPPPSAVGKIDVPKPEEDGLPPCSPLDPPIKAPTFFYRDGPTLVSTVVPPPPKFDPLPPPPIKMGQNFQPIQVAPVSSPSLVRLVNPKPVMPANAGPGSTPLSNYFPMAPVGTGSLISAAFTPTVGSNTVFLGSSDPKPTKDGK